MITLVLSSDCDVALNLYCIYILIYACLYVRILRINNTACAGKQADTSAKETGKKRHKQMPKDNKQLTNDISTSSDISDTVPMDTTDNTISTCPSNSSDTVGDVTQLQVTKRPRKLRKRSLPAMSPSNNMALLEQNDGNSKAKKKRKSLDSILEGGVNKKVTYVVHTYIRTCTIL